MSEAPIKVLSSMATRGVLVELASAYERATSARVETTAAGGVDVAKRLRAGEPVDVVVLARDVIDALIAEGHLLRGSRVDLVTSPIAVAVQAGAPHPNIADEAGVRAAVAAARSLSYSTGPSGRHLEQVFERWGLLEAIRSRIIVPPPGVPVASLVAEGSAEIGFQQLSELIDRPGIDVLGLVPAEMQSVTTFSGGIGAACARPDAARALLDFMVSPEVASTKQRYGLASA